MTTVSVRTSPAVPPGPWHPKRPSGKSISSEQSTNSGVEVDTGQPEQTGGWRGKVWLGWVGKPLLNAHAWLIAKIQYWDRCCQVDVALLFALARVPPAEDIRNFYRVAGDGTAARNALIQAHPINLYSMNNALKQALEQRTFSNANIAHAREWLDALLGNCESLDVARRRCKMLFLRQHPDKVGQRDFGTPLRNMWAYLMWDLLVTTRAVLADTELSPRLYGRRPLHVRIGRALGAMARISIDMAWRACVVAARGGTWLLKRTCLLAAYTATWLYEKACVVTSYAATWLIALLNGVRRRDLS